MKRLVILRPEPGAGESLKRAEAMGLAATAIPLFEIRPLPWTAPDSANFDGLLLTSANAVRHGGSELDRLKALPVHAVGQATADAARAAGFQVETIGDSNGAGLVAGLPPEVGLLHLSGRHHRPLPAAQVVPVYESAERADVELGDLHGTVVAVHSPRAGERLAELVADRAFTAIAAISANAAAACGHGWQAIKIADQPTDAAVLALAARLCNTSGR